MKYLSTLIIIFSLAFAFPGWSEESDVGFNFEEMENLNVLLCMDETNKNNKKAFAISKNKDGTYDVFSDNFGLIKLTEVEKDLILNIPQEATMLLFNKSFTDISGLLAGESFKADCFDITAEIALSTEYVSTGAISEIVRLTEELSQSKSELGQIKTELSQASSRIERLEGIKSRLTTDLVDSRDKLQKIKIERGELVTKKYNLLDEVENLKEDNSNYLNRLNKQISKISNLGKIVDEKNALLEDSDNKLLQEESKFKNASNKIDYLLDSKRSSEEKLRLKNKEFINFRNESTEKIEELKNALERNGLYEEYFKNSDNKIKIRSNYKNGQLDGVYKKFSEEGYLLYYQTYKAGQLDGLYCDFFKYHKAGALSPSKIKVFLYKQGIQYIPGDIITQKKKGRSLCEAAYKKRTRLSYQMVKILWHKNVLEGKKENLDTETTKTFSSLENFKAEFFGEIRKLLETQEGVRLSGDRFVFSSEILFDSGEVNLSLEGKRQIIKIADLILSISDKIPSNIDWILRVDGHTDDRPIRGGEFANNWELSQARALSVVLYMQEFLNIPAYRLAATGFGEYQPIRRDDSDVARAVNRRIEIVLTER